MDKSSIVWVVVALVAVVGAIVLCAPREGTKRAAEVRAESVDGSESGRLEQADSVDAHGNPVAAKRAPNGLRGLRFGMARAEAVAALPELAEANELDPVVVHPEISSGTFAMDMLDVLDTGVYEEVPGDRLGVSTTLGGYDAGCELEFAVDDTLSRMVCTLEAFPTFELHQQAERKIVGILTEKYGSPIEIDEDALFDSLAMTDATWIWKDAHAQLVLSSRHIAAPASAITLDNSSQAHRDLIARLTTQVSERHRAELERMRKAEVEVLQRQLDESGRPLEGDL